MKLVALVIAALVGAGATYAWKTGEITDLRDRLEAAEAAGEAAREADSETSEEESALRARIARMQKRLRRLLARLDRSVEPSTALLEDGRHFGFIKEFIQSEDGTQLVVDIAEFLTGEEADRAAAQAGAIEEGEQVPNDYFIRNENPLLRTLAIAPGPQITLSTWDRHNIPTEKTVDLRTLIRIFEEPDDWEESVSRSGYWLTLEDQTIVVLEEQYVP